MRRTLSFVFLMLAVMCFAMPLLAQATPAAAPANSGVNLVALTSGFAMAIASGLCGLGQGKATASATEALARNPGARPAIQVALILGLALIESLALYTFVIIFVKVK